MKIIKLEVNGFRSLKAQTWCPGDLNVIIGPNASGKSNLLRALETLSIAARGGLGEHIRHEGGIEALAWDGRADRVRIRVKIAPIPRFSDEVKDALEYDLKLLRLGTSLFRVAHERLAKLHEVEPGVANPPLTLLERSTHDAVVYSTGPQGSVATPSVAPISEEETILSLLGGPFTTNRDIGDFQQGLASWKIYQSLRTDGEAPIRAPRVTRAEKLVDSDGQNLISVLHTLYTTSRDFKDEINTAMRAAFGEDFDEIVFPPAADQRIQLRIRWRSLKREQSAADLSDGILRFLFLLAILANPEPPRLIAIDEPESGLHPSMMQIVAEYAREASKTTQVILTTHSPELLDAFGESVPTTTVVERHEGETLLRTIAGEELSYWLEKYSLGELYRSSELEALR